VQWAPIPDRAILGSINELIYMAKVFSDLSPAETGKKLAETPMTVLGGNSPNRVFPKLTGA
jgi:hypothetical protein